MERKSVSNHEPSTCTESEENRLQFACDYCIKGGEEIREEMQNIAKMLDKQNKFLRNLLLRKQEPAMIQHRELKFPLKSEEELVAFDQEITAQNRDFYVEALRREIKSDVKNNLHHVLSLPLLHSYNVHGIHDKKRLKSHDEFYYALIDAIESPDMAHRAERLLQKAFLHQKRRYHQKQREAAKLMKSTSDN